MWAGRPRLLKLSGDMKGGPRSKIKVLSELGAGVRVCLHVQGSESTEESVDGVCAEGVCPVSPIGRGRSG